MKRFLVKILYFFLPIVVILYPLDYNISYFLSKSNNYPGEFEVWNDIYNSRANCDIAICGSSRAWVHIDPKIIMDSLNKTAYNFGIDGHNFWLQYLRYIEFQKHNKKPQTVILSVDMFSLQKSEDLYQPDQFLPYMLWNTNIAQFTDSYIGYNKPDYYIPLIRYAGKFEALKTSVKYAIINTPNIHYRTNGFRGMDKEWNTDLEKAKSDKIEYEVKVDHKSVELFELFIQECKTNQIELILVYTPEYIEGQKYVSNRNDVINIYDGLSKKYHLTFLDYSNDSICLDKKKFYNASHLNKKGAEIFSKKLAKDIKHKCVI